MASRTRRSLLGWVIVAAMSFLPVCALVAGIGVSGRVVDRETGRPVEGAVVSLQRTAHCASFHAYRSTLPPAETRTDEAGRFSVGSGRTSAVAGCLSWAWSRTLRILAPGYLEEFLGHDDSWLGVDPRRQFDPLKTEPVMLERMRYALEVQPYLATSGPLAPDDSRPGPAWDEAVATIRSPAVRPTDSAGVFVRRSGAAFDQIVVIDLLWDRFPRRRTVVLARDRRTGGVHGWTQTGEVIALPLPAPNGWSLVGASGRLGVPLLERDSHLYFPEYLDWTEPLRGLSAQSWSRVGIRGAGLRAVTGHKHGWMAVEAGGATLTTYSVVERLEGKSRLKVIAAVGAHLVVGDVLPGALPPVECLTTRPQDDSLVMVSPTADGRGLFVLPWWKLSRMEWQADRATIPPRALESAVVACPVSPPFLGLAAGRVGAGEVVYAVAGDDAVNRFAANGEPDRRLELDLPRHGGL